MWYMKHGKIMRFTVSNLYDEHTYTLKMLDRLHCYIDLEFEITERYKRKAVTCYNLRVRDTSQSESLIFQLTLSGESLSKTSYWYIFYLTILKKRILSTGTEACFKNHD